MAGTRIQRHVAGQFDDSDGTVHSKNFKATAPAITWGQVLTRDAGESLKACAATDLGPCYLANKAKALNATRVDALWGDNVIFYVVASGTGNPYTQLECAAGGKLAALGSNSAVAVYVKHGTKNVDGVTDLPAFADGDIIGVKFLPQGQ